MKDGRPWHDCDVRMTKRFERRTPQHSEIRVSDLNEAPHLFYRCMKCGIELNHPLDHAGREEECPDCGFVFNIPTADESA